MNKIVYFQLHPTFIRVLCVIAIVALITAIAMSIYHKGEKEDRVFLSCVSAIGVFLAVVFSFPSIRMVYEHEDKCEELVSKSNRAIEDLYKVMPSQESSKYYEWCDDFEKEKNKRDNYIEELERTQTCLREYQDYLAKRYKDVVGR